MNHLGLNIMILPIVGMVVTISPSFSLYNIVVFPAASRPTETRKFEPAGYEKTNNMGFRPGLTQTRLYSHSIKLEA